MKTSKILSKALAMILCVVMVLQMMPLGVFADETDESTPEVFSEVPEDSEDTEDSEIEVYSEGSEDEPVEASYTVEHHLQTEDGYAIDEAATETKTGEVGAETAAAAKSYEGYSAKEITQGTIAADGSTVVVICYDKIVPEIVEASYTVEHHLQTEDGYAIDEAATETKTGEVGAETAAAAKSYEGYTAKEIAQGTIAADGSTVVVICYDKIAPEIVEASYTVEHHLQTEDGYAIDEAATETKTGEVGAETAAAAKTYEGYTAKEITQGTIAADGTTVVAIYYDVAAPATVEYKVEHYLQTEDGYAIDEAATETKTGEVGAATAAAAKEYEGYTANPFEQGVIAEDGSTVVKIEYSRDPVVAGATANGLPDDMTLVTDKKSELAPGIQERKITAYDKNGDQVLMYIATADLDEDTVEIYANYMNNQYEVMGMQKTTEQAAAFEANHEGKNVVVAINGSYFNTSNGRPSGAFVMEGTQINDDNTGNAYSFFAILKNGTAMIGSKGEYTTYKDQIQEAIGGYIHLVKDGAICAGLNQVDKYPRQTVGITEDGKVIIMTADCIATAGSIGLTVYEQAEVMLSLGCVEAVHLDGGGSGTYCSKQAGSDTLRVTSNPSNGTERAVSNTLILVSTAKPDGEFDRANLTAEHSYVTPGSVVTVSAVGIDQTGGAAEIPADVSWQLTDSTLGTLENGVFTSNGTVGKAVIQLLYKDAVVGSVDIEVVNPQRIDFGSVENIIVPYGQTADLPLTAYYGVNKVFYNAADFNFSLEDSEAATIEGLKIIAAGADSGITATNLTVTLKADETVTITVPVTFGKGSEVVFDFEEGTAGADTGKWIVRTHESDPKNNEQGEIYIVNRENGLVHDGEQALAFHTDFSQTTGHGSNTGGYLALSLSWNGDPINIKGAQSLGFWLYIPEDATTTEVVLNTVYYDANGAPARRTVDGADDNGEPIYTPYWSTHMEESGWHYVKADLSKFTDDLLIHDEPELSQAYKRNFLIKIYCVFGSDSAPFADFHGDFTYYIDNITVDYSSAVEDRELPVFGSANVYGAGTEKSLAYGKTVDIAENNLTFAANVTDNTGKNNYTGINESSAKVYVDGNSIGATYANGMLSSGNVTLAEGYHRVRFEIADNNGNVKSIVREINITAASGKHTVELVPQDASLDRLLSGSVYWVDLVSEDIADIKSISTVLNLNSIHSWELDYMIVADGFDAEYYYASANQKKENNVSITFSRNGQAVDESSNVIASIPIRVWDSRIHTYSGHGGKTPAYMWTKGLIDHRQLRVRVDKGLVTFADDTSSYFSDKIVVDHESYTEYYLMDTNYHAEKGSYHVHTAAALVDLAATCTETGYTGRTWCNVCDSPVVWGTTIKATGHAYAITDGVLKCACGQTFTGTWTDGKDYVDGLAAADGWSGNSFYQGGVKLTGVQKVPAPDASGEFYYNFGEDGVCAGQMKFSGLFYDETVSAYRYAKLGEPQGGWIQIDGNWHYFNTSTKVAVTGDYYYPARDVTYHFDETGMTEGVWQKTTKGTRFWYGKWYYQATGSRILFVEIEGKTYNFDKDGYLTTGIHALYDDWTADQRGEMKVWEFDENGVLIGQITDKGLIDNKRGGMYLVEEDGFVHGGNAHVASYNGDLYFVVHSGKLKQNGFQEITSENSKGLLPDGKYYFGEDCKLFTGVMPDAEGTLFYYENGKLGNRLYNGELVKVNDDIYLVQWSGKVTVNETRKITISKSNGLQAGTYEFDAEGKGTNLSTFTGIKRADDGILYYYVDGEIGKRTYNGELVQIDGATYLVQWSGKVTENSLRTIPADKTNGLLKAGTYYFGENGELFTSGAWKDADGLLYYYKDGKLVNRVYNGELVEINGDIYLVQWSGKVTFDSTRTLKAAQTHGLVPAGTYTFGADGKMLPPFTGVKKNDDGLLYYYKNDKLAKSTYNGELVEINGDIYLVQWSGKVTFDSTRTLKAAQTHGLIAAGTYYFGKDGKLFTGVKEEADGLLYYYKDGKLGNRIYNGELVEINGDIYLVQWSGKVTFNSTRTLQAAQTHGLVPAGTYTFGADGKLIK